MAPGMESWRKIRNRKPFSILIGRALRGDKLIEAAS